MPQPTTRTISFPTSALMVAVVCLAGCFNPNDGEQWDVGSPPDDTAGPPADDTADRPDDGAASRPETQAGDADTSADTHSPAPLANCDGQLPARKRFRWDNQRVRTVSLALGPTGCPRLSMHVGGAFRYAIWNGEEWEIEIAAQSVGGRNFARQGLVIPPSGPPSLAYTDPGNDGLYHATRSDDGEWSVETIVDISGESGPDREIESLAHRLDPAGHPTVAVLDELTDSDVYRPRLVWFQRDGGNWQSEVVDRGAVDGSLPGNVAFDAAGRAQLLARGEGDDKYLRRYLRQSPSAWPSEEIVAGHDAGMSSVLTMDAEGDPHLFACTGPGPATLRYFRRIDDKWRSVDRGVGEKAWCTVLGADVDADERLHLVYTTTVRIGDGATLHHEVFDGGARPASEETRSSSSVQNLERMVVDPATGAIHMVGRARCPTCNAMDAVYARPFE